MYKNRYILGTLSTVLRVLFIGIVFGFETLNHAIIPTVGNFRISIGNPFSTRFVSPCHFLCSFFIHLFILVYILYLIKFYSERTRICRAPQQPSLLTCRHFKFASNIYRHTDFSKYLNCQGVRNLIYKYAEPRG